MKNSIIKKRWVPRALPENETVERIVRDLNIRESIGILIAQRGLKTFEEAKAYFNPALEHLHDPFLMKGMDLAVERIREAISGNKKILVYGDYDVDGTTSVAVVYSYLTSFYSNVEYYVPDRFTEGYGISRQGVEFASENGCGLMIVLDCGIKAIKNIRYAGKLGIDVIVCDHHTPGEELPPAHAILNPRQRGCDYPYKELSGCGIGYKLITAYFQTYREGIHPHSFLDLVALSIASDIVPITGENRILAHYGLLKLNREAVPGLQALIETSGAKIPLDITDVVFKLGPRINAAGRLEHASLAVKILISKTLEEGLERSSKINHTNSTRQDLDARITDEAFTRLMEIEKAGKRTSTVLFDKSWHKGVIGIVASRLIEKVYRPTVLLTESNGYAVGSGRSIPGFNLYNALDACKDILVQFGGHAAAAGLTLKTEDFDRFSEMFDQVVSSSIDQDILTPLIEYDIELNLKDIDLNFYNTLRRFGPFGPENMKPLFVSKGVVNRFPPRVVGEDHLKLCLSLPGESNYFDGIAFRLAPYFEHLSNGKPFDICFTVEENNYKGKRSIQLNIKDFRIN